MKETPFSKMKILMLADVFFPDTVGGAGRFLYHLSLELSRRGHEIHIMTRNPAGKLPACQQLDINLFVHRFPTPNRGVLGSFFSEIKNTYFLAKKIVRSKKFDLLCVHQSLVALGPLLLRSVRQFPIVYQFQSPWHEEFLIKVQEGNNKAGHKSKTIASLMRLVEKRILLKARKVLVLSQFMSNKLSRIHHYPPRRIAIMPGGADLSRFCPPNGGKAEAKKGLSLSPDRTIFLTVRNLVPRMGIDNLIEAFHRSKTLKAKGLLLIGGEGFLENRLKSMVENYNLNGSILFLGHIPEEDLPKMYQAADFFVLPTKKLEGFGLVAIEAMACGTPALGTPVGAIPEVIGAFDRRLLFHSSGWLDIKKKLEEVVNRSDRYDFKPEDCRKFVEDHFSWKKVADRFEQEVLNLAEG